MKKEKEKKAAEVKVTKSSFTSPEVRAAPKRKDSFKVFNRLMAELISTLVDDRVRGLIFLS